MKKTLLSLAMVALASCGGGGGGSDSSGNPFGAGEKSIIGLWDGTENLGQEGIDEIYYEFGSNNMLTVYDYAGDSYDQEDNCYWIFSSAIKSLGNNKYEITSLLDDEDDALVFIITRDGDKLTIDFNGPDEPDDKITIPRSTKSTSNFTPECADTQNARLSYKVGKTATQH